MSHQQIQSDGPEAPLLEQASFDIDFIESGAQESGYRTRNNPDQPYERTLLAWRRGLFQAKALAVIHGRLRQGSEQRATLLIYDLDIAPNPCHRVTYVSVLLRFKSHEVVDWAPKNRWVFQNSSQNETQVKGYDLKGGFSQCGGEITGSFKNQRTVESTTTDAAKMDSELWWPEGRYNTGVRWFIRENETTKSGMPSRVRTALLLERKDDAEFSCAVDVKLKTSFKSRFHEYISREEDEPVLYNPSKSSEYNSGFPDIDGNNLGSITLTDLVDLTCATEVGNTIKHFVPGGSR
ncbi:hypothetical protein AAL_07614 [Moelleriella libera RCEF 2490]|uniref:Uncharacterized protein n=1 Tax=Moelleriella libera RCEF 2490 TaxID=1081109 RepID=A0A167X7D0_9HYPO|nr:hypothetical protein AAL_07614 [Moelleriella libera RCEF 2490]